MAFLSAGAPDWTIELGQVAGQGIEAITVNHPQLGGVYMRPDTFDKLALVVTAASVTGPNADAVWAVASELATWWPEWLGPAGVTLRVWLPALVVSAAPAVMVALADGEVQRPRWMERLTIERGLMG